MKQIYLILFFICIGLLHSMGQNAMRREDNIPVVINGDTLRNPWVGGLHAPQFSEADIDNDGHKDLVIFNRAILASNPTSNGYKVLTFRNNGTPGQVDYDYKPEWERIFPPLVFWMKLDDVNCDGTPDMLSAYQQQLAFFNWYEGMRDANGLLYFEYRDTVNTSNSFDPVQLQRADFPGVGDVDRDGDVDFINFNSFSASFMFYKNSVIEAGNSCADTMQHDLEEYCWGQFYVTASGVQTNIVCPFKTDPLSDGAGSGRHNGGSVLVIDLDGDNDDDLLYGEVDKAQVFALYNGGDNTLALVDSVDSNYPSYNTPAFLPYYPLSFGLDVNNDGKKDILVAPSEPFNCTSKNAVWWYENISPNDSIKVNLAQTDFLESGMIELGMGANPALVDYNADSLLDLVVGNYGYFRDSTVFSGQLALFINVGTPEVPIFELEDDDWLGLSSWYPADTLMAFRPAFGDIDSDGDMDLFMGDTSGTITFFENTAGADTTMVFALPVRNYFDIDALGLGYSAPLVYDVNNDSLLDFLVGTKTGVVRYFENRGTSTAPQFDIVPTNNNFGGVDVGTPFTLFGYAGPVITTLDSTGQLYLLSGNEEGRIYGYEFNPDSIYSGAFTQVFNHYSGIDAGERTAITVADITNDGKPEMLVGNHRGGLEFFTLSDTIANIISVPALANNINISVFPNPTAGEVFIKVDGFTPNQPFTYSVTGLLGNVLAQQTLIPGADNWTGAISLGQYPSGLYMVRIAQGTSYQTIKIIKY